MAKQNDVWLLTIILTILAGYCDTITFVAADRIFSAHVTGNFIVFAYQIISDPERDVWVKLMTFPIFMVAVMTGGWISKHFLNKHLLLFFEGIILLLAGLSSIVLPLLLQVESNWPIYLVTMIVVFAMGLQNAFGRIFSQETFGPTTVMTGNVTQFALDVRSYFVTHEVGSDALLGIKRGLLILGGFLLGCLAGGVSGKLIGLAGVLFPAIALIICYIFSSQRDNIDSR